MQYQIMNNTVEASTIPAQSMTMVASTSTITINGASTTANLRVGIKISVSGFANSGNNGTFTITALTTNTIVLADNSGYVNETSNEVVINSPGNATTIFLESAAQWNQQIMKPGETTAVPEATVSQLLLSYPTAITIIGPFTDPNAPVSITITLTGTWTLYKLGRYCTNFQFITTSTNCLISFSGWNTANGETAPAAMYQIPITPDPTQTGGAFTLDMPMDSNRSFYVKGTGTLIIIGF